jgi:hypothetical protein
MDSANRYDTGDRYQSPYNNIKDSKNSYTHHSEAVPPPLMEKQPNGDFGRAPTEDVRPTDAELQLLRKLRTLQAGEYEAQYFDTKHAPNQESIINKLGNPTPL